MGEEGAVVSGCREEGAGGEGLGEEVRRLESENAELKRLRAEDARANEKVVSLFASQEQAWMSEKKKLRLQIQALFAQFRVIEAKKEDEIAGLNRSLEERKEIARARDEVLEVEAERREELEEKVRIAEEEVEKLRGELREEAEGHSAELLKQKTAFAELLSSQQQLEAEMDRVRRQVEETKRELEEALEQKESAAVEAKRLLEEIGSMQKDGEQKDKILSAMLRKSKLDTAEKQVLIKEVKVLKAMRKQAEIEAERWRATFEPRRRKGVRESYNLEAGCSHERRGSSHHSSSAIHTRRLLLEFLEAENRMERECLSPKDDNAIVSVDHFAQRPGKESGELIMIDVEQLQEWVGSETEKYAAILEQRHYAEIEAFAEQMRFKDEKLEKFQWQLLTAELELQKLQSHMDGLDGSFSHLRKENLKLETMLLDKEKELKAIKDRFTFHVVNCQKNSKCSTSYVILDPQISSAEMKISKIRQEDKNTDLARREEVEEENEVQKEHEATEKQLELQYKKLGNYIDIKTTSFANSPISPGYREGLEQQFNRKSEVRETKYQNITSDIFLTCLNQEVEDGEEKEVDVDPGHTHSHSDLHENAAAATNNYSISGQHSISKDCSWKVDLQAMGVSYKIKRLKQQLLVLEKLAGKDSAHKRKQPTKGFICLMNLLNKQVKRYRSLEDKADDLCKRMHESEHVEESRVSLQGRTKEQSEKLEQFLEETFQLQRYMVATGQKLMELQPRICNFVKGDANFDESAGFNIGQFADIVRSLLREIQRGLEVRIVRIIGKLEGTLAREGILR